MILHCLVIDDEPLARKGLREYIEDVDFLVLDGEFDAAHKAVAALQPDKPQLLFLDIQMPRLDGLRFLRSLPQPPPVVLTTAYPQYALEGFELDALDYLVKPIAFDRFLKAALKVKAWYERHEPPPAADHFFLKTDGRLLRVRYDEVLFVEAVQNYVYVHTAQRKHLSYLTFHAIEEFLPAERFVKTHKSYLVALDKVDSVEGNLLRIGSHAVPLSRGLKEAVLERLLRDRLPKR